MHQQNLRGDCEKIVRDAIGACLPDTAVRRAMQNFKPPRGRLILIAVGKAAWNMARAALESLPRPVDAGLVITKYGHSRGTLENCTVMEAGHPVPDDASFAAARAALSMTEDLCEEDTVLFLLSGGGSALFELPRVSPETLRRITGELLSRGASIGEINTVRKRISAVKGGRFALHCAGARVVSLILSDVLGDTPDTIASGPTCPDPTTCIEAFHIAKKYDLTLDEEAAALLAEETPKELPNAEVTVIGGVSHLCAAAADAASALGYAPVLITDHLDCEARRAGAFLGEVAKEQRGTEENIAFITGGEPVVTLCGDGLGGRAQELALAAAAELNGTSNAALICVGSDGTDGPTDAAGGFVDGESFCAMREAGIDPQDALERNDSYHALHACGGLVFTGPTGTNVNDLTVLLIRSDRTCKA